VDSSNTRHSSNTGNSEDHSTPGGDGTRARNAIRRVPQEELPGIQPLLFRELDRRIAQTRLEHEPLPDVFLSCESEWGGPALVFRGERYDLSISLFDPQPQPRGSGRGSGVFVVSNGAGVATNTVDQLSSSLCVAGMIDLKRDFSEEKISAAFEMIRTARPDVDALAINMISGIALARDTAAALDRFCASTQGAVPVIFRFSGPYPDESRSILRALEDRHECVSLADSTRDLVEKTNRLFGVEAEAVPESNRLDEKIEAALEVRSNLGVTLDPDAWLTPERTLEHVFGHKEQTRVGVLGFGRTARFQMDAMKKLGVRISWAVTPSAIKYTNTDLPAEGVFPTVEQAVAERGDVDIVLNYAPAAHALEATRNCLEGSKQTRLMILVAENMHYEKASRTMDVLEEHGVACIGPNSPGVMIVEQGEGRPDLLKLGNMPAELFGTAGGMSVVARSGTVIFDIVEKAAAAGIGTRLAWAIGGDRYTGLGFLDALAMLEQDPHTRFIVLGGESGGIQEQLAALLLATGIISKPVVALVTGESLPAGVQYGHQGSVKFSEADDPQIKQQHLLAAGAVVVSNPTELVEAVREIERIGWDLPSRRRQALWAHLIKAGKASGFRWHEELRPAYDLLYDLVDHYRIFDAHERTPDHLHELATHLAALGVERFSELLSSLIRPEAFATAFTKSREYVAELVRGIREAGIENFTILVEELSGEEAFNKALATTPWAAADLINEAHEIGIPETQTTISKTMGVSLFRETLAERPWNTAHALRSMNNMRWWRYVRAYDRYCTHLTGDNQLPKASWRRNPWASVKLVRGYDRMPEGGMERALDDADVRALFVDKSRSDPQGLLELGKAAFHLSRTSGRPFHELYGEQVRHGVPDRPDIDTEIERMGREDFEALLDSLFTRDAFEQSRTLHRDSAARALRMINDLGDDETSGARKILNIYRNHLEAFDTPVFRLAVTRNLWMVVDLLRATSRIDIISANRIIDYVVSPTNFNYSVAEHQWGTSQAFHKIADMGARKFLDAHRILEDVTHDRECFGASFKKNPRDAVEIVQVVANLGKESLGQLLSDREIREAFLTRMRVCPRNAAHFLQEVAHMGASVFAEFAEHALGRPLIAEMLRSRGCNLVHSLRRINIVGVEDFRRELRTWQAESDSHRLTPGNALEVVGLLKEHALERRFSDPDRRIPVTLHGQPTYRVSEGEIRGLYQSYGEWGDILFKLQGGEPTTPAERVDLYRLVSGRKRFQTHMVQILANFQPLQTIRARITSGDLIIRELRALRGVTQGATHRFDAYFHTLEVLDQLVDNVLPLDFMPETVRQRVHSALEQQIGHVSQRDLLILATALHDLGKTGGERGETHHAQRSVKAAQPILTRFGMSQAQKELVVSVIAYHAPSKLRQPGELWDTFVARGGLDGLYQALTGNSENPYPIETFLHYHADILGRRGSETSSTQVERRKQVTSFLLERYLREHPEQFDETLD
jgi:succinyl-CoA synthetase alpha subunit